MHIVDGALSLPVLTGGAALAAAGVAIGLRHLQPEHIPRVAMLSAVFFLASLLHVPFGASNVHLVMNGLLGILLGWVAFPALLIALLLQAVFFGFGGLLVLGVNTFNMALPAVVCFYLCRPGLRSANASSGFLWGILAGALAVSLSGLLVGVSLALSGQEFYMAAQLVLLSSLPVMVVDGLLTGAAVVLMQRVKPEVFGVLARAPV